jgi:hypothetical protein
MDTRTRLLLDAVTSKNVNKAAHTKRQILAPVKIWYNPLATKHLSRVMYGIVDSQRKDVPGIDRQPSDKA